MNQRTMRELSRPDPVFQTADLHLEIELPFFIRVKSTKNQIINTKDKLNDYLTNIKRAWSFSLFQGCEHAKIQPSIQQIFIENFTWVTQALLNA